MLVKAGTKIIIGVDAGLAGTEDSDAYQLSCDYTTEELDNIAWQMGLDHAAMYGIYPAEERPDDYDEDSSRVGDDEYSDDIEGYWKEYVPKEHEGQFTQGNEGVVFTDI